ncbi:MAG: glutamate synthase central domain-containing protein, partial [Haloferacaceae archaeon]
MTKPHSSTHARGGRAHGGPVGLADPTDERSNCGVGAIVDLDNGVSHDVVADGIDLLRNLEHRGTTGAEENTGDGAGIMLQRPDEFFAAVVDADLPETYAVGAIFMPQDDAVRERLVSLFESTLADYDLEVFHWRDVPTDNSEIGETALDSEPDVWQAFVAPAGPMTDDDFDRALYLGRRAVEAESEAVDGAGRFYVCSLDRKTVVYKGLLTSEQLDTYYPDLTDERMKSTLVLVHARFSTNTLGAWHLAHPYRKIIHNGEINTIQGNVNWMRARESSLEDAAFGDDIETLKPVTVADQSDTASVDNAVELLMHSGRELPHVLRMLIPEAHENDESMDPDRRDWYDYHASLIEPWDGPALVAATDGEKISAVLDRNGLRPCRYDVTADNRLVVASEVGALETPPSEIRERGRLQPGQIFVADPEKGRVIPDDEVFDGLLDDRYGEWVDEQQQHLDEIADANVEPREAVDGLRAHQATFGYTNDQLKHLLEPMANQGKDPVGSMGDDTPLSVLGEFNRPLFTYFKQLFAQVSNPPIDYIREELVTSLHSRLGKQRNLMAETPEHAYQVVVDSPVLTDEQTKAIKGLDRERDGFASTTLSMTYDPEEDLESAVERLREAAREAIDDGSDIVVLSDRDTGPDRIPIPSLLATGAVHHDLVRHGLRTDVGLVVESGDPREVHHLATLVGYGAGAVNPYLAYQTISDLCAGPDGADEEEAIDGYIHALEHGL